MKTKINAINILKWIALSCSATLIGLVLFIRFSPYKKLSDREQNGIHDRVMINRPVDIVFDFMCQAGDVKKWMLYIDHVDMLTKKADTKSETGTVTRFYTNSDETGQAYDVKVLQSIKNKKRVLKLYNFTDFPITFNEIINEQVFTILPENKCELNMKLYYKSTRPDLWDEVKAHVASYRVKKAFRENMENLKTELESIVPENKN
jgi:hypothetical protein